MKTRAWCEPLVQSCLFYLKQVKSLTSKSKRNYTKTYISTPLSTPYHIPPHPTVLYHTAQATTHFSRKLCKFNMTRVLVATPG